MRDRDRTHRDEDVLGGRGRLMLGQLPVQLLTVSAIGHEQRGRCLRPTWSHW